MRVVATILFLLLLQLNGCTNLFVSDAKEETQAENSVLADKVESDRMDLYTATSANRNALQEEANIATPTSPMRVLTHRNRTVNHNFNIRTTLLSTHHPVVSKLIHHSVTQLVAFPKEYHIFRLRRIRI